MTKIAVALVLCLSVSATLHAQRARAIKELAKWASTVAAGFLANVSSDAVEATKSESSPKLIKEPPPPPRLPQYKITLKWQPKGVAYYGTLRIRGTTGTLRVRYTWGGDVREIDQTVRAQRVNENRVHLIGSAPTIAGTTITPSTFKYFPDTFSLIQKEPGTWVFEDSCDEQGCAPVEVLESVEEP